MLPTSNLTFKELSQNFGDDQEDTCNKVFILTASLHALKCNGFRFFVVSIIQSDTLMVVFSVYSFVKISMIAINSMIHTL